MTLHAYTLAICDRCGQQATLPEVNTPGWWDLRWIRWQKTELCVGGGGDDVTVWFELCGECRAHLTEWLKQP